MRKINFLVLLFISYVILFNSCSKSNEDDLATTKQYFITFESNGGSSVIQQTINAGSKAIKPNNPIKEGVLFDEWYIDKELTNAFDFDGIIKSDIKLYAKWSYGYKVNFQIQGNLEILAQDVVDGRYAIEPLVPKITDYVLGGWYANPELSVYFDFLKTKIVKNTTVYGKLVEAYTFTDDTTGPYGVVLFVDERYGNAFIVDFFSKNYKKKLKRINIPKIVTSIGPNAFEDCTSLTNIIIPNTVNNIGSYAFFKCSSLSSIEIPNNVSYIGNGAFVDCTALKSITLPNSIKTIDYGTFVRCYNINEIIIPNGVERINDNAFLDCKGLKTVSLPISLKLIDYEAFKNCSSLKDIVLPNSITFLGWEAFKGCTSLDVGSVEIINSTLRTEVLSNPTYYGLTLNQIK